MILAITTKISVSKLNFPEKPVVSKKNVLPIFYFVLDSERSKL